MKKEYLILSLVILSALQVFSQTKDPLDNGFGLKIHVSNYASSEHAGYGFELTNQWSVAKFAADKASASVLVSWLDASLSLGTIELLGEDFTTVVFNSSLFEIGPQFSYKLAPEMAVDAYFQIRPTFFYTSTFNDTALFDTEYNAIGLTQALGFNYRYRVFLVGLEFGFGTVTGQSLDPDIDLEPELDSSNTRFVLGFKF